MMSFVLDPTDTLEAARRALARQIEEQIEERIAIIVATGCEQGHDAVQIASDCMVIIRHASSVAARVDMILELLLGDREPKKTTPDEETSAAIHREIFDAAEFLRERGWPVPDATGSAD